MMDRNAKETLSRWLTYYNLTATFVLVGLTAYYLLTYSRSTQLPRCRCVAWEQR